MDLVMHCALAALACVQVTDKGVPVCKAVERLCSQQVQVKCLHRFLSRVNIYQVLWTSAF